GRQALAAAAEDSTRLQLLRALAAMCAQPAVGDAAMVGMARAFLHSPDDGVRAAALLLIGVIAADCDAGLADDLAARLEDGRIEVRAAAARLLGDLAPSGHTALWEPLARAARATEEPGFRRAIIAAARRIGTRAAEPLLRQLADDADLGVARAAAQALSELLSP